MKTQSIPNGTKVRFSIKDLGFEDFGGCGNPFSRNFDEIELEKLKTALDVHEGRVATVECLETAWELGITDFEYYNIIFDDGQKMYAISGYHLTPVVIYEMEKHC